MGDSIVGTCLLMCPEAERRFREKEGLLHAFEIADDEERQRRPKADPQRTIKCYSRSVPGKSLIHYVNQLRPGPTLLSTIQYLFTQISTRSDVDWARIYNFIFDRLRAIRQDLTVQRLDVVTAIKILEPIVRFHVYSAQRLCERSLQEFVPKFNNQHVLECIKELLVKYEDRDSQPGSRFCSNRAQIEMVYILLYLGDRAAIERALELPLHYRNFPRMKLALRMSLAWYLKNYVQVCRTIVQLPPLLAMAAMENLPSIRRDTLQVMSSAYNSTLLTYFADDLRKMLLFQSREHLFHHCRHFGLDIVDGNISFQQSKFKADEKVGNSQRCFPEKMLHSFLPRIILN